MIFVCPYCGCQMAEKLIKGMASCSKCTRVFDNSLSTRLLAASWLLRQNKYHGIEQLISDTKLSKDEALFVYTFISENFYSHDEFYKTLKSFGIIKD